MMCYIVSYYTILYYITLIYSMLYYCVCMHVYVYIYIYIYICIYIYIYTLFASHAIHDRPEHPHVTRVRTKVHASRKGG